ncbi:S26 family signal peptidase [Litorimonas sp.]|uniref:S26 family signal peptidase n=1 Tax=Litorimonas sp. TaxID=1892381 RepID=UPI003A86F7BE
MLFKSLIAGVMTLAIIGTAGQIIFSPKPVLLYNPSESAAVGWYRLRPDETVILGAQVAAYAPKWARKLADERGYLPYDYPLIKTVWAVHGDEVCYNTQSVSVPKRPDIPVLGQDVLGRDMPQKSGCIVLGSGEYMLLSPDVQTGFDSRYFGPVRAENILGVVEYLENPKTLKSSEKPDLAGFEG